MKARNTRITRWMALITLTVVGTSYQACLTRVRDDVMLGFRSYFINDFIPSLGCFLVPEGTISGCDPDTTLE